MVSIKDMINDIRDYVTITKPYRIIEKYKNDLLPFWSKITITPEMGNTYLYDFCFSNRLDVTELYKPRTLV
jgi:hypothetical protein